MYGGGPGYPPQQGYPPSQPNYPPQQQPGYPPQPGGGGYQPASNPGIGFDNLMGGSGPGAPYGGGPPTGYPGGGGPPTQGMYPGSGPSYPSGPSFAGAAMAATAAVNFNQSHQGYPSQQPPYGNHSAQQPYGNPPQQHAPYGNPAQQQAPYGNPPRQQAPYGNHPQQQAPYGNHPQQQAPYGNHPQQQAPYGNHPQQQAPYGNHPQQQAPYGNPPAPSFAGAAYAATAAVNFSPHQQALYNNSSTPAHQMSQMNINTPSSMTSMTSSHPPKRPPPPSSTPSAGQKVHDAPTQGTVRDASNFDAQRDAEVLRKAMKGMGTDEKAITTVLGCRSSEQRQQIKLHFATMFGKDLIKELKGELSGHYEEAVLGLLMTSSEYDAFHCREAIAGLGTDEKCLIEILCSRNNSEIIALRDTYKKLYKNELERDLIDDTSGYFKRLLVSLVQGGRDESGLVDTAKAQQDAQALYDAGEARWGTDESRFNVILASRGFPQLRATFDHYERISKKKNFEKAISSEMSGDVREGMLSVVKCARSRPGFYAERLYKSMKGLGTDDRTLIRVMVSRCEVDMVQVKQEFQKAYGKTLESFISDDCSGDYKKILLQLCRGN